MGKEESLAESNFPTFTEWAGKADSDNFDEPDPQIVAIIGGLIKPYHKTYLRIAREENCNNARDSKAKNKGYLECLEYGWLVEKQQIHGGYKYFALTEIGKIALRNAPEKVVNQRVRLQSMPPRVPASPPRLASAFPKR